MKKSVNGTSSSDETEEPNVQQPEQPESSRSKRGGKGKMVEVEGKASLHQPKKGGLKRKRKIKVVNNYQELEALVTELKGLKDTNEELVKEKEKLLTASEQEIETLKSNITVLEKERDKSKVTALELEIERIKSKDPALELKIETQNYVVTTLEQGIETLKSRVTAKEQQIDGLQSEETALEQRIDKVKSKITAMERKIERQKSFMENMSMDIDSPTDIDSRTDKGSPVDHMDIDSEEQTDAFPLPPPERPAKKTCTPTTSTLSSGFTSSTCQSILQFATELVTQNHLLSTAGGAESREATHDKQASASALGIKGTTDVQKLEKNMEASVSRAIQFALEIVRAQRESSGVNADEYSANQANDTANDDN